MDSLGKVLGHTHSGIVLVLILAIFIGLFLVVIWARYEDTRRFNAAKCTQAALHHRFTAFAFQSRADSCTLYLPNGETVWLSYLDYEEPEQK